MKRVRYSVIALSFAALSACESADKFVGDTLAEFRGEPKSRLAAKPPAPNPNIKRPIARPKAPPPAGQPRPLAAVPNGQVAAITSAQGRLLMPLQVLNGGTVARRRFTSLDRRHVEEDALWTGPRGNPVTAGMLLSESLSGPPITDAQDPAETADHWAAFRGKRRSFGDLVGSKNVLGPVLWRRSRVSSTTCVVFLQRWYQNPPTGPASLLAGFYCAAPGETLTPGEAETVVQSLGISAPGR